LVAQLAAEGALLAALGGIGGLALAVPGVRLLQALGGGIDIPRLSEVRVDGAVLAFTICVTLLAAVIFSVLPLVRLGSMQLVGALKDLGRSATVGRDRHRARMTLVVSQVALALLLLVGSGLMARSFARLRSVNPGFDASHVLTFRIAAPQSVYKSDPEVFRLYESISREISALPGVQKVGATSWLPLADDGHDNGAIWIEDYPTPKGAVPPVHDQIFVNTDYFATMHIPLLAGRGFSTVDPNHPPHEVIVSRSFAQRYWKGQSPIGKRLHPGPSDDWSAIVGVVDDVHIEGLEQAPEQAVYFPLLEQQADKLYAPRTLTFVVRSIGDATAITGAARRVVQQLASGVPVFAVRPMTDVVTRASARTSFTLFLLALASGAALLLGAIGIYGVISYMVSLRTREIGVRMALGAAPGEIGRMVSRQGLTMAGAGVVIGLVSALALTRYLRTLLFEISPTDPLTLGGVAAILLVVALAASWLPARRAAHVDPAVALRAE
jgi:predicted permease